MIKGNIFILSFKSLIMILENYSFKAGILLKMV
jgi:hypothetical protein